MNYAYHKRVQFQRTFRELLRDLWQAFKDAAHRFYVEEFNEWRLRR